MRIVAPLAAGVLLLATLSTPAAQAWPMQIWPNRHMRS